MEKQKKLTPLFHESCRLAEGRHLGFRYAVAYTESWGKNGYLLIPDDHPWFNLTISRLLRLKNKRLTDSLPFYIEHTRLRDGVRWIGTSSRSVHGYDDLPDSELVRKDFHNRLVLDENGKPAEPIRFQNEVDWVDYKEACYYCLSSYRRALCSDRPPPTYSRPRQAVITVDHMVKLMKQACKVARKASAK